MITKKKIYLFLIISAGVGGGLLFYYLFNPQSDRFLIKCPFKYFTGYDCPGCGSQRALHAALHGHFREAFSYNPLFIIALPYVLIGIFFEWFGLKHRFPKTRKFLFGSTAIYLITAAIIGFVVIRNL